MLTVATGCVWAQTAPAPAAGNTQTKAQPTAKASTTAKPAVAAAKPAKPAKKTTTAKKPAAAAAPQGNVATNVAAAEAKPTHTSASKRDPFVSPVKANSNEPFNCGTGKRCLVVDQTNLEGIVKAPNGMIAVVSNPARKAYFLRENDPVYNGFVVRITPDTVVFREQVTDKLGKKFTREGVKKVSAPAV